MAEEQDLLVKYAHILELNKNKSMDKNLAILYEISINHIKSHYNHLKNEIKCSIVYVVHRKYLKNQIACDQDAINIIDDYMRFHNIRIENFVKEYNENEFKDDVDKYIAFSNNYINS